MGLDGRRSGRRQEDLGGIVAAGLVGGEEAEERDLRIPGYGLLNLRAAWKPAKSWELYASVNNVFDKRYETFGALAETQFTADGRFTGEGRDALFVAPGTERAVLVGARFRF